MVGDFRKKLAFGKVAESLIAQWLLTRGNYILPVYEILENQKKGPRLFTSKREYIAPDILIWGEKGVKWIEAKHKTVFTWHRITKQWTTGIDRRHYRDYVALAKDWAPWPIWLLFLHENSEPDKRDKPHCPLLCPVGLYGGNILSLSNKINHEHDNWGPSGMVYWAESQLTKLAALEEMYDPNRDI